ncbi:PfkB family carbohydrate kinase [Capnocytophaga stomatis]|uniref:PfkB family carbohydrate kinase n=1 Tax=Capnocytophaga stomatis TaxID=1848904 RepID=UPI001AD2F38A|nr:PfkB family carbohydrate kinase [Capnocytophaga stomatis]GIM50899.1 sugar kinase [Capnocytophaga stomatis]
MDKLLIVGTVAFDTIETPFGKIEKTMGGAANYIAIAASQFSVNSAIVSIVGEDYPKSFLNLLEEKNVDISAIETIKGGKSFFWSGKYHNDMNVRDTLETQLNVLSDFKPVIPEAYKDAQVLMLGNLHPKIQLDVLRQMNKKPNLVVLDTMDYWMNHTWELLIEVINKVDVITINDQEARQLTGEYSLVKAAQKIMNMGVKYVVIKKGEHGVLLFHQDSVFFAPALPLEEVFDPTGAGDTFAGGMVGFLTSADDYSFESIKNAVIYGSNLASFCVEKFGAERVLELSKEEMRERLFRFKELTQFEMKIA